MTCRRSRYPGVIAPYIFQHPIIHANIPRMAPVIEPKRTADLDNLPHETVRAIGITAGLRITPLHPERVSKMRQEMAIYLLEIEQPPEIDTCRIQLYKRVNGHTRSAVWRAYYSGPAAEPHGPYTYEDMRYSNQFFARCSRSEIRAIDTRRYCHALGPKCRQL